MTEPLISAENLAKHFDVGGGGIFRGGRPSKLRAVDDVALSIMPGETLGLVGESGCGKSTLGRLLIRLLDPTAGSIRFQGQEITGLGRAAMREFRRSMQIIFQDPYGALNPRMAVEDIIAEPLVIHGAKHGTETRQQVTEMLDRVGLPRRALDRFPHEFSCGQRQRIGIARALYHEPQVLVLDEATSSLDIETETEVMSAIRALQGFKT
ncbi:MAG: ATP-binding cassette domain-containing protein, partial [Alphaproteobacteria bacterium]